MDPFLNGTGKNGTGQVAFTRENLSERSVFFARVNGPLGSVHTNPGKLEYA